MDPTLAALAPRDRVWVICEQHRLAQRGIVIDVGVGVLTVRLPQSAIPPQRYDRFTGMWMPSDSARRSNHFFIRTELPPRFHNPNAQPAYCTLDQLEASHAPA